MMCILQTYATKILVEALGVDHASLDEQSVASTWPRPRTPPSPHPAARILKPESTSVSAPLGALRYQGSVVRVTTEPFFSSKRFAANQKHRMLWLYIDRIPGEFIVRPLVFGYFAFQHGVEQHLPKIFGLTYVMKALRQTCARCLFFIGFCVGRLLPLDWYAEFVELRNASYARLAKRA